MPKRRPTTAEKPQESRALVEQPPTNAESEDVAPTADELAPAHTHGRAAEYRRTSGEVFKQHINEAGVVVLDRKLTADEAAAQDAAHRQVYAENRARRFGAPSDWERIYGPYYTDKD